MIDTRLILFEGIPGSGKTITSQLLYKYLIENGIDSNVFVEGCDHPIDLPFYAFLSINEYNALLIKYPQQGEWLRRNSIIEEDYVLTPYKVPKPKPGNDELVEDLETKEFCYSNKAIVPFNIFKKVFYRRFKQYVATASNKDTITIFESVLFQHQIHDINRLYPQIKENEIIDYIGELATILSPLNPILFYITQDNIKESLEHTALIRSKPKWSSIETIDYYTKRKNLELKAIEHLLFHSVILNNTDHDWNKMFETIRNSLEIVK